jgi:hypothetical protein
VWLNPGAESDALSRARVPLNLRGAACSIVAIGQNPYQL